MRPLAGKTNVQPPDGQFPFGRIKNNDGSQNGTPVDESVYGDFHQFFEKLMSLSGIAPNNLPENQYSGFQLIEALKKIFVQLENTSPNLKTRVIEIGEWDMASFGTHSVEHGLPLDEYKKVRSISVIIRDDDDEDYYDFLGINAGGGGINETGRSGYISGFNAANPRRFTFVRTDAADGGRFENSQFNAAGGYNRGWVTIMYVE